MEPPSADLVALVDARERFGDDFVTARLEAEGQAVALLNERAGSMTREEALELGRYLNRHAKHGTWRQDRFSPAFHGAAMYRLIDDLDRFNAVVADLWTAPEDEALDTVGRMLADRAILPGAGPSLPSILMYLRDQDRWAVLISATHAGLDQVLSRSTPMPKTREAYETFCTDVRTWRGEREVAPQEVDAVLTALMRQEREAARAADVDADDAGEVFGTAPLDFMAELVANNDVAWMASHKARYQAELREPFVRLLEAIADRHLRELDPQLETQVKTNKVLASIKRRFDRGEGPYQPHFWGAFSRFRKQEDVQLAVLVDDQHLNASLYLGSSHEENYEQLRAALEREGEALLAPLAAYAEHLRWEAQANYFDEHGDDEDHAVLNVAVVDKASALAWLDADGTSIRWPIDRDDPLLFDPSLPDRIGEFFRAVHPLAAAAWGDDVDVDLAEPNDGDVENEPTASALTLEATAHACHLPVERLEQWVEALKQKQQAYFYGPPGTGKTHVALHLARLLATSDDHVERVQFHPSYSYEDFVEGLRPQTSHEGALTYAVRPGVFLEFCTRARRSPDERFVIVLDEMNRADLASVFGELLLLLEYRGDTSVVLPYSQKRFSVPRNVVVLATMNTADRSLAVLDFALRRRFLAFRLSPSEDVLASWLHRRPDLDADLVLSLFRAVATQVGEANPVAPGHSYWMVDGIDAVSAERVWELELRPYLEEHWFDQPGHLEQLDQSVRGLLAEHL